MADDPGSMFISGMLSGQQFKLNQFALQEAPVKLQSEKLALKVAQSDYDKRQKMAEMLAQDAASGSSKVPSGQDPLVNAAEALAHMGGVAAKVGLTEEAVSDLSKASTIMAQTEDAAYKKWQTTLQQTKYADQLLAGVTDQATLDAANAHIEMTTGKPSALKGAKYSPELIADLQKASVSKRTAAQEALTRAQERKTEIETLVDAEKPALMKTQEALNIARTNAANKVGGDGLIAQPKNITAVTNKIRAAVGDDNISVGDARTFAGDIALDAEARMKRDHITQEQAVNAAVEHAQKHGVLAGIPIARKAIGSSPQKPLPLPKAIEGFKNQKWYTTPDGPQWYDEETKSLYPPGSGPGDEEETDEGGMVEEDDK